MMKAEAGRSRNLSTGAGEKVTGGKGAGLIPSIMAALRQNGKTVLLVLLAFFLARVYLPGGILPLGYAIFAAALDSRVNFTAVAIAAGGGVLTTGFNARSVMVIMSILLLTAIHLLFSSRLKKSAVAYAITVFACNLAASVFVVYINGFLMYDLMMSLLQCVAGLATFFLFNNIMTLFVETGEDRIITPEELACVAVTIILCVSGFPEISIYGIGLRSVVCIYLLIIFSHKGGFGTGAATGLAVGLLTGGAGSGELYGKAVVIALYSFCGFMAGIFSRLGKAGTLLGFIIGNAGLAIILNGSLEILMTLREIALAGAIFFITPAKLLEYVKIPERMTIDGVITKANYSDEVKRLTIGKLNAFSESFGELARAFREISGPEADAGKNGALAMIDRAVSRVCTGCGMREHCWKRSFYDTYKAMFSMVEGLDGRGKIRKRDIPEYFSKRCERIDEIAAEIMTAYEIYKTEIIWKQKLAECRELFTRQLFVMSGLIKGLAAEVDVDIRFKKKAEDAIAVELGKAGYKVESVTVFENKWGKYEVTLNFKGCGGKRECAGKISGLISEVMGRKMTVSAGPGGTDCFYVPNLKKCKVRFIEEEKLRVMTGVAGIPKDAGGVSGDNFSFMECGDGKYIAAICDGMGTGKNAGRYSRAVISLLEQFIESGFDKKTAISMINSVLVMKPGDEVFTTIDLSIIDLHSGEAEFVKHGSMPTIIKRALDYRRVEVITSNTLPVGIINNVEAKVAKSQVENGDFIIMMTDGVIDAFGFSGKKQDDIIRFIESCETLNPQEMADLILKEARASLEAADSSGDDENPDNKPIPDDMLVLVMKIWERV